MAPLLTLILLILLLLLLQPLVSKLSAQRTLRRELQSLKHSRTAEASGILRSALAQLESPGGSTEADQALATARYLVLDTEAMELIGDKDGADFVSPLFALSWQLLDAEGHCLLEQSYMLEQAEQRSEELQALQGMSESAYRAQAQSASWVLAQLSSVLRPGLTVVAHHMDYHLRQLRSEAERLGYPLPQLEVLHYRCLMQEGCCLGFKQSYDGELLYPSAEELFRYLYHLRQDVVLPELPKALRDLRLTAASLRKLLSWGEA